MKIHFWSVGKAHEPYVKPGIDLFTKRVSYYFPVDWELISSPKNASTLPLNDLRKAEAETILHLLQPGDVLVALDEKGKQISSEQLADFIQKKSKRKRPEDYFFNWRRIRTG